MAVAPSARTTGVLAKLAPGFVTVVTILPSILPLGIPDYGVVAPDFLLLSAYYWTLFQPAHLSYLLLFMAGLLFDLAMAGPIGLTSLLLLLLRGIMLSRRRFFASLSFPSLWAGFTFAALSVALLRWLVGSLMSQNLLDPRGFVFQTVLTVACYPIFTLLMAKLQRALGA
jgi:rod shape-determining protein MreD